MAILVNYKRRRGDVFFIKRVNYYRNENGEGRENTDIQDLVSRRDERKREQWRVNPERV